MTNENYSPDEIRLLDKFAGQWMAAMVADSGHDLEPREWASDAYGIAAAMIAERRKRVPSQQPLPRPYAEVRKELGLPEPTQPQTKQQPSGELTEEAIDAWRSASVLPVKSPATYPVHCTFHEIDRAVALMREGLRYRDLAEKSHDLRMASEVERDAAFNEITDLKRALANGADDLRAADAISRVALDERDAARVAKAIAEKERDEARAEVDRLRTWFDASGGAKITAEQRTVLRGYSVAEACRRIEESDMHRRRSEQAESDICEVRAELNKQNEHAQFWKERADRFAAEVLAAQPVLDAVAEFGWGAHEKACLARELLANYADRRRNEERAKQQGGAS